MLRDVALWLGAGVGTLCLIVAVLALVFGATPLVFRTGSMGPTIPTGSLALALATPSDQIAVGDVVSMTWHTGIRVTHRVVEAEPLDQQNVRFTTRGDANDTDDTERMVESTTDRVVWSLPGAGFVVEELEHPQWVFLGGLVIGGLLTLAFYPPRTGQGPGRMSALAVLLSTGLVVSTLAIAPASQGTLAAFNDPARGRSTVSTTSLVIPTITSCTIITNVVPTGVRVTWSTPTGLAPTGYRVNYTANGLGTTGTISTTGLTADIPLGAITVGSLAVTLQSTRLSWISGAATRTVTAVTSLIVNCTAP
ncbi:MAG: hypothetical protein H7146_09245 [Burkholderiaceae bacterium]|nr:hypothetical protein [Microbacteriaceae bacterium]